MSLSTLKIKIQKLIKKAEQANILVKWVDAGWLGEDDDTDEELERLNAYDFVNNFGINLTNSNFSFSQMERTIYDLYTTHLTPSHICLKNFDYLTKVIMPNVVSIAAMCISNNPRLEYCEFGNVKTYSNSISVSNSITEFKVAKGQDKDLYLQKLENLSKECLENIIDNFADCTGRTSPILYIGEKNIVKLSDEYIIKARQKNISLK